MCIEVFSTLCFHTLVIHAVVLANSTLGNFLKTFLLELESINKFELFSVDSIYPNLKKKYILQIFLTIFVSFLLTAFDALLLINYLGFRRAAYYTDFYISQYLFVIIFFQIYTKVDILFLYFENLNDKLRNMGLNNQSHVTDLSQVLTEFKNEQLKVICKIHIKLCKLIHMHNDAHGWQIVIIFVLVFSTVLNALYPCLAEQVEMRYGTLENETVFIVREIICIIFYCVCITKKIEIYQFSITTLIFRFLSQLWVQSALQLESKLLKLD